MENLTCKQYLDIKMTEYKKTNYYKKALELKKKNIELANKIITDKENKYITEWKEYILEYGKTNRLDNKIIYSYINQFGYNQLIYDFRRVVALDGWIPSENYTLNQYV